MILNFLRRACCFSNNNNEQESIANPIIIKYGQIRLGRRFERKSSRASRTSCRNGALSLTYTLKVAVGGRALALN